MLALIICIVLLVVFISSPAVNIHSRTGFWCCSPFSIQTYYFNAIDHGFDHDSLSIFSLRLVDQIRFITYVQRQQSWNLLPLAESVFYDSISDSDFDYNMKRALDCTNGFYYYDKSHSLYVYDSNTGTLYIRDASSTTSYKYQ